MHIDIIYTANKIINQNSFLREKYNMTYRSSKV